MFNVFTPLLKRAIKGFKTTYLPAKELFYSRLFSNFDYAQETFFLLITLLLFFFNCPVILISHKQ